MRSILKNIPYLESKRAAYQVLFATAVFVVGIIVCALIDDEWRLFEKTFCYLGVSDILFVRIMYPICCTVIGISLMVFGYSVAKVCDRKLQAAGYYSCILFGISLLGIGLVNMDFSHSMHMAFVYLMGVAAALVLVPITIDDIKHGKYVIAAFVIFVVAGFIFFTIFDEDYQQPFTILGMFVWLFIKSCNIIRTGSAY